MKIHCIQHVPFEDPGYIEHWLSANGHRLSYTKVWENAVYPEQSNFDVLVIMGGPMGVYDENIYPWLAHEKKFIAAAVALKKRIVGICLGAQLLASSLGAPVTPNIHKEIGWFPVRFEPSFSAWLGSDAPVSMPVFHWHGDRFEIPSGGINHARSAACDHQLFTIGEHIIGIQFHFEATQATVKSMIDHCRHELITNDFVQTEDEILRSTNNFASAHFLLEKILEKICAPETIAVS